MLFCKVNRRLKPGNPSGARAVRQKHGKRTRRIVRQAPHKGAGCQSVRQHEAGQERKAPARDRKLSKDGEVLDAYPAADAHRGFFA